jgi:hypothetical protein
MSNQDDAFRARIKRVRARTGHSAPAPAPSRRRVRDDDAGDQSPIWPILRPQLALVLGALAMIAGRAFAMTYLMLEPDTDVLSGGEGAVVLLLLVGIGLMFGTSQAIAHGALVVGAALAFLAEGYYIALAPELMSSIYDPEYVGRVLLGAR